MSLFHHRRSRRHRGMRRSSNSSMTSSSAVVTAHFQSHASEATITLMGVLDDYKEELRDLLSSSSALKRSVDMLRCIRETSPTSLPKQPSKAARLLRPACLVVNVTDLSKVLESPQLSHLCLYRPLTNDEINSVVDLARSETKSECIGQWHAASEAQLNELKSAISRIRDELSDNEFLREDVGLSQLIMDRIRPYLARQVQFSKKHIIGGALRQIAVDPYLKPMLVVTADQMAYYNEELAASPDLGEQGKAISAIVHAMVAEVSQRCGGIASQSHEPLKTITLDTLRNLMVGMIQPAFAVVKASDLRRMLKSLRLRVPDGGCRVGFVKEVTDRQIKAAKLLMQKHNAGIMIDQQPSTAAIVSMIRRATERSLDVSAVADGIAKSSMALATIDPKVAVQSLIDTASLVHIDGELSMLNSAASSLSDALQNKLKLDPLAYCRGLTPAKSEKRKTSSTDAPDAPKRRVQRA